MTPKLVFYSEQQRPLTDAVDAQMLALLATDRGTIGYIPSAPDPDRRWFANSQQHYAAHGIALEFLGLEDEFDGLRFADLEQFSALLLSGGNTFRFSHWLRKRSITPQIRQYVARGGVLIGVSAGAILMTPDIGSAAVCGDAHYGGLADHAGLALVDFLIVPHFDGSARQHAALERLAVESRRTVYGVPDGGGIIVDGSTRVLIGEVALRRDTAH